MSLYNQTKGRVIRHIPFTKNNKLIRMDAIYYYETFTHIETKRVTVETY